MASTGSHDLTPNVTKQPAALFGAIRLIFLIDIPGTRFVNGSSEIEVWGE
jgi:hypothetical protein